MIDNACACQTCAGACAHKPGWFKPEQLAPLAAQLGLTEKELFDRHLQVDWYEGEAETNYEDVFVLSPAVVGGDVGDMFDRDPRGKCVWYVDGKCQIHELGKPFECAAYHHTDDADREIVRERHCKTALAWHRPEHQEKIEELLGRKPQSGGGFSIFEALGGGW